jgi:hypothetical protein
MREVNRRGFRVAVGRCMTLITVLLVAATFAGRPDPTSAQTNPYLGEKVVKVGPQTRVNAVMITRVTVGSQEIQCGLMVGPRSVQPVTPFQAGQDWLKSMTIYLYNRTNKSIVFIDVPLGLPETGNGRAEPQWIYHIQLGRIPAVDAYSGRTGKPIPVDPKLEPLAFGPDQTLVVHAGDYIDQIGNYVQERMLLTGVTKLVIHGGTVFFDDGMRWQAGGGYSVPVPEHPGRFNPLDGNYFPGIKYRNWPPGYQR